jgi:two-component system phosphate regulon sensor histidine kinase PhoR
MSGKTIRIFVVLAIVSIAGIVLMQVYWFKQAFDKTEYEFDRNLNIALNETVKGVLRYNNTLTVPPDPVKRLGQNYYAVMVNDKIHADVLEHYLRTSFQKFNIRQSFEYRIFDCAHEQMVYGGFIE